MRRSEEREREMEGKGMEGRGMEGKDIGGQRGRKGGSEEESVGGKKSKIWRNRDWRWNGRGERKTKEDGKEGRKKIEE